MIAFSKTWKLPSMLFNYCELQSHKFQRWQNISLIVPVQYISFPHIELGKIQGISMYKVLYKHCLFDAHNKRLFLRLDLAWYCCVKKWGIHLIMFLQRRISSSLLSIQITCGQINSLHTNDIFIISLMFPVLLFAASLWSIHLHNSCKHCYEEKDSFSAQVPWKREH